MKKLLPYLLIGIAAVSGIYVQQNYDIFELRKNDQLVQGKYNSNKIDDSFEALLVYPSKKPLAVFSLIDQENTAFTNTRFKGFWNVIFTGYTNCPDVCPNTLTQLTQLYNQMDLEHRIKFQFIFLSVDPDRDSPVHLKNYLGFFHEDFIGISGKPDQIDSLINGLGGIYSLNKSEGEFYSVDHSARIFIVGPNAERFGIFKSGALTQNDKTALLKDLINLIE